MKFWKTRLTVTVLEFEFHIPKIIKAETYEEAEEQIKAYAKDFYGGGSEETDNGFEFFGGCPIVTYDFLHETTKEQWQEEQWEYALC